MAQVKKKKTKNEYRTSMRVCFICAAFFLIIAGIYAAVHWNYMVMNKTVNLNEEIYEGKDPNKGDYVTLNVNLVLGNYAETKHRINGIIPIGTDEHYAVVLFDQEGNLYVMSLTVKSSSDIDALEYNNIKASFVKAEQSQDTPEYKQIAVIQAMINMALLNGQVSNERYKVIEEKLALADIPDDAKISLLETLGSQTNSKNDSSYDVDYEILACDPDYAEDALCSMMSVVRADSDGPNAAEQMYLTMTAKAVGITKERLSELL